MPQEPDRNLALELVRVTEAAALACARWVGFGDKIAADRAAVDAMRHMLATVEMDGVVVIGEGEKDEAPMLFNGERIGTHQRRRGRRRGRSARGHRAGRARPAQRAGRRGRGRVGHDVRPRAVRLHGEARLRRRYRRAARPGCAHRGDARDDRPGQARARARPDGGHARPPPPRGDGGTDPGRGRAHPLHLPRRRRRLDDGGVARHGHRPAVGDRRHAGGRALGRGLQVPRRPVDRQALAARRRTRPSAPGRPGTT